MDYLKTIQKFCLMDDDFMSVCFEDNLEGAEVVLNIILDDKKLRVNQVQVQNHIKNLQGRSAVLDIYASDYNGRKYDIEIQRESKGASAKRARYNSSLIDTNITEPGDGYEQLAETYVIFITETDVMGQKLPIYHIDRMIKETGEYFGDESHIIYVNGECRDDTPLGKLVQDFFCTDPSKMKYKVLAERVRYFKENPKGVEKMCKLMEEIRMEGRMEGRMEERKELARSFLNSGKLSNEEIAKYSKLSIEEVNELVKEKDKNLSKVG